MCFSVRRGIPTDEGALLGLIQAETAKFDSYLQAIQRLESGRSKSPFKLVQFHAARQSDTRFFVQLHSVFRYECDVIDYEVSLDGQHLAIALPGVIELFTLPIARAPYTVKLPSPSLSVREIVTWGIDRGFFVVFTDGEFFRLPTSNKQWTLHPIGDRPAISARSSADWIVIQIGPAEFVALDCTSLALTMIPPLKTPQVASWEISSRSVSAIFFGTDTKVFLLSLRTFRLEELPNVWFPAPHVAMAPSGERVVVWGGEHIVLRSLTHLGKVQMEGRPSSFACLSNHWALVVTPFEGLSSLSVYSMQTASSVAILVIDRVSIVSLKIIDALVPNDELRFVVEGSDHTYSCWTLRVSDPNRQKPQASTIPIPYFQPRKTDEPPAKEPVPKRPKQEKPRSKVTPPRAPKQPVFQTHPRPLPQPFPYFIPQRPSVYQPPAQPPKSMYEPKHPRKQVHNGYPGVTIVPSTTPDIPAVQIHPVTTFPRLAMPSISLPGKSTHLENSGVVLLADIMPTWLTGGVVVGIPENSNRSYQDQRGEGKTET
jgi:hypothetical protein